MDGIRDAIFAKLLWYYRPDSIDNSFGFGIQEAELILKSLSAMKDTDVWLIGAHCEITVSEFRQLLQRESPHR